MKKKCFLYGCLLNDKKILFIKYKNNNYWSLIGRGLNEDEKKEYFFSNIINRIITEQTGLYIIKIWNIRYEENNLNIPFSHQEISEEKHLFYQLCLPKNMKEFKLNSSLIEDYKWLTKEEIMSNNYKTLMHEKKLTLDILEYVDKLSYLDIICKNSVLGYKHEDEILKRAIDYVK